MPKNLTPNANFNTTIPVPTDGDAANGASLETAFQSLTDRTEWLKANAAILGENETVTGTWTFNQPLTVPTATGANHAVKLSQAQGLAATAENNAKGYADSLAGGTKRFQLCASYIGTVIPGGSVYIFQCRVDIAAGKKLVIKQYRSNGMTPGTSWFDILPGLVGGAAFSVGNGDNFPAHTLYNNGTGVKQTADLIIQVTVNSGAGANQNFYGAGIWLDLSIE